MNGVVFEYDVFILPVLTVDARYKYACEKQRSIQKYR